MELPFIASLRVDQSKITGYLLNERTGRGKATFFLRLGFHAEDWETLAAALKAQARDNPVALTVDSPYGKRYSVDGAIGTPDNRQPRPKVRTVWILETGTEVPRLITAHPV
ncbi:MAG: hypothetical protein HY525_03705 [Betaproteobacteria bacterium]|nr:hypothetical protein [Betaproteobacteria bacterium]